jgi:hypothetical protein
VRHRADATYGLKLVVTSVPVVPVMLSDASPKNCWLDINQLFKPDGITPNNVLPIFVPPKQDGPFDPNDPNLLFRPLPIAQAIQRARHQCLIAEVAFDPTPIPLGKDSSNWDKLAQRNIAWSDVNSAQAGTPFEIRPTTAAAVPARQTPDELMIDWNNTPAGGAATIYLPAVQAADVLVLANRLYAIHSSRAKKSTRFAAGPVASPMCPSRRAAPSTTPAC